MKTYAQTHRLIAPLLSLVMILSACANACGPGVAQTSERQAKAQAVFAECCKTAGEKIYKTVENVEGIYVSISWIYQTVIVSVEESTWVA